VEYVGAGKVAQVKVVKRKKFLQKLEGILLNLNLHQVNQFKSQLQQEGSELHIEHSISMGIVTKTVI